MKDERLIVRTMERLGIATAYGNRTQAIDYLNRTLPASCGFVAYNPFMPARVGWENYTIYIGGEDDMLKARILEGELTKWFNVRYEQYPRTSGTHIMMNVSVRAKGHLIGAYMGGGGQQEPDALNFTMPNGGTITLTRTLATTTEVTLEYSTDAGATWMEWAESSLTRTLVLNAGEKVYIRNTSDTSTGFSLSLGSYYKFSFSDTTQAGGNVNSLLCKNPNNAIITPYVFAYLFHGCTKMITAPLFPAKTLDIYCYANALRNTGITESPILPAKVVPANAYNTLFYQTASLVKITTMMEDITASDCLKYWALSIAATGDFYCPSSLTIPTGYSGIPTGWTRHDI